jgi:peptidoglycan DL-endopeptidase CwlO
MKTIIHKQNLKKLFITLLLAVSLVLPLSLFSNPKMDAITCSSVAQCEALKAAKEQEKELYQNEVGRLQAEADTLAGAIATLSSEKSIIQAQIDINQAEYNRLTILIEETEQKIKDNQDALGVTIANMYVEDDVTPLEMLASSKTISDYLDAQEYRTSVRNELAVTITDIKALKESLDKQKDGVEKVLGDQINARQALIEKENQQQNILSQTQGRESLYQKLSEEAEADLIAIAEAYKLLTYRAGTGISDPSKGNYPWGGYGCYVGNDLLSRGGLYGNGTDPLGYACRQCTSYVAWKILEYTGKSYTYWGHAKNWPNSAANLGIPVGTTARARSVGVMTSGFYGHVVWVETDPDAQGNIIISQYNSYHDNTGDNSGIGWGNYSKKKVSASDYNRFIYIK